MKRRIALLTECRQKPVSAKTAVNLIRYCADEVVVVVDAEHAGKTSEAVFGLGGDLPVVASLDEAPDVDTLAIGIAPAGGGLPPEMRATVLQGVSRGLRVVSGLHDFLVNDPEIRDTARRTGAELTDVRRNVEREVAHRKGIDSTCLRILTVGHDCNVGKMVVSLEIARALLARGEAAKFVATGQTGIMIEGDGCPIDAVVGDFLNGAAERLVLKNQHHRILLIEGQGSLVHPRYSAVTLGLLHGCIPNGLILCYEMGRSRVAGMEAVTIPSLKELVELYERMARLMHPCRVLGVAMNSSRYSAAEAGAERQRVANELGLPVCDVIRDGPEPLVRAVLRRREELNCTGRPNP